MAARRTMEQTRKIQKQKLQKECTEILLEEEIQQDEEEYMEYFPLSPLYEEESVEEDVDYYDPLTEEDYLFLCFN